MARRVSPSRKRARVAMPRMLATSWVTTTTVVPSASRSSRMSRSSRRPVGGSRLAEGSSMKRISGSSAMARASPARFCMPPESSQGWKASKPWSPTSASFSSTTSWMREAGSFVNCWSGSATFSASVIEVQSALPW